MPKPGGQLLVCCLTHIPSIKGSNDEINKKFNCNDGGLMTVWEFWIVIYAFYLILSFVYQCVSVFDLHQRVDGLQESGRGKDL